MTKVDMCKWYEWDSRPICKEDRRRRAGIKCHSKRLDCPAYEAGESCYEGYKEEMSSRSGGD